MQLLRLGRPAESAAHEHLYPRLQLDDAIAEQVWTFFRHFCRPKDLVLFMFNCVSFLADPGRATLLSKARRRKAEQLVALKSY
jgi:hypothetical protein